MILNNETVQQYIDQVYYDVVQIFTDGSKDPDSGITSAVVFISQFKVRVMERTSNYISVFTSELIAIALALQWVEEVQPIRSVTCTDFLSALHCLLSGTSTARQYMIFSLFRIRPPGIDNW